MKDHKCEFLIKKIEGEYNDVVVLDDDNKPIMVKCNKKAVGIARTMWLCKKHLNSVRKDNTRRFKHGDEIIANDCSTKKRL